MINLINQSEASRVVSVRYLLRKHGSALAQAVPLLLINRTSALLLPWSGKYLIDDVVVRRDTHALLPFLAVLTAAALVQVGTTYAATWIVDRSGQHAIGHLREVVHRHLIRLKLPYHDAHTTGTLASRVMNDVEGLRSIVGVTLLDFLGALLSCVLVASVLLYLSPLMTGFVMVFICVLVPVLMRSIGRLQPLQARQLELHGMLTGRLSNVLGAIRVVKAYRGEERINTAFSALSRALVDLILKISRRVNARSALASLSIELIFVLTLIFGIRQVVVNAMSLGEFFVYSMFLRLLGAPLNQMTNLWNQMGHGYAALGRVRNLLSEVPEDEAANRTIVLSRIEGTLRFENVTFNYEPASPVLRNISFTAQPGTITALVGHSGAGKSTIANLIGLFYAPSEGIIRIDGQNAAEVQHDSYRRQLGLVFQDSYLFDGTIRENICFSRPDATMSEFDTACRISLVDEFAGRLPDGYDTVIGERGVKLSGGQRQRIAIARVVLADPKILILDEATSNIDSISASLIEEALAEWMRARTAFIISHRLSAIRVADQILVLEGGEIVQRGTHHTLIEIDGVYSKLYRSQYAHASAV